MKEKFLEIYKFILEKPFLKRFVIAVLVYLGLTLLYSNLVGASFRARFPSVNRLLYSPKLSVFTYFQKQEMKVTEEKEIKELDGVLQVKALKVNSEFIDPTISSSGTIEPVEKVEIYSKVNGRIDNFFVSEGENVTKGQKLLKIESLSYEIELAKQEAALSSARAKLKLAVEKYNQSKKKIEVRLNEADKRISNLHKTKLEYERALEVYEKKEKLLKGKAIPQEEFKAAELEYKSKESAFQIAKRELNIAMVGIRDKDIIDAGYNLPSGKKDKLKVLIEVNTIIEKAEMEVAEKEVGIQQANVTATKILIRESTIYSPIVGVVSERYKSRGVLINAGGMNSQAIMSLVKIDSVYATFFLNEADASKISVNMEVQIKTDIYPEKEFKGTVKSISPEIDKKTHTARVKVELKNPDYKLKPGMFIRSEVVTGKKEKVILIQSRLIKLLEENVAEVFVLKPTSEPGFFNVFKVKVKPGKKKEDRIEILDGLKEGDLIAAEHLSRLRDGLKVKALVE